MKLGKTFWVVGLLLLAINHAVSDQIDHLIPRFSGTSASLNAIAFGAGSYIAVGDDGIILKSSDSVAWSQQSISATNEFRGVTFANGLFVAVGDSGAILTSPNGGSWTVQDSGVTNGLNAVASGGGMIVAVGDSGTILFSTNGVQWNSAVPTGIAYNLNGVAGGNGSGFVAVGDSGTLLTSPDGKAWTIRFSGTALGLNAVGYIGPNSLGSSANSYVVVGQSGVVMTGSGSSWTVVYSGTTANLHSIALDTAGYYSGSMQPNYPVGVLGVVGDGGTFLTSSDGGNTWDNRPTETTKNLRGVAFENGGFLAVGDAGSIQAAFIWVKRNSGVTTSLNSIAFGNNRFVIVGESGTILTSTNGANWFASDSGTTDTLAKVIFANNHFMAVGGQTFDISANGIDWTSQIITGIGTFNENNIGYNTNLNGIAYGNGVIVAIATFQENVGYPPQEATLTSVLISSNAVNWLTESTPLTPLSGLAFGADVFCGGVVTSPDGVNWTTNSGPSGSISFANGRFYAVGGYFFPTHVASEISSSDGSNWVSTASGYGSGLPCYGDSVLVAVGPLGNIIMTGTSCYLTSLDGTNWTSRGACNPYIAGEPRPSFNSVAFGNGQFVAVGVGGVIDQSVPVPSVLGASLVPQGINIKVTGDIGRNFALETTTNLTSSSWTTLLSITNAPYATNLVEDATNIPQRYYRTREW